uniref:Probable protein-export membrane protein SecG n=1 Tax=Flintiella sanguinaria TaxID=101926 RepID=A0A1X9PUJ8_9RHOD|nr:preprotein translocase SecG subunit [Flintiella sanguinaria]
MELRQIIKLFWYITTILLTIFILINNPKSNNIGFNSLTRTSSQMKKNINNFTWFTGISFIIITVVLGIVENN